MADTKLTIFQSDGTTAAIDYRTEGTNGDGRQVVTIGDPSSNNAVAAVQATDPNSNAEGIVVRDVNTSAVVARLGQTISVQLDPGHTLGSISSIGSSVAVYFDRANPNVTANAGTGSFNVQFDPGHTLGKVEPGVGTFQVFFPDTGHEIGAIRGITNTIAAVAVTASGGQTMDENSKSQRVLIAGSQTSASLTINGTITGITNSIAAHILSTGGTLQVKTDPSSVLTGITSSVAVYFDRANPSVAVSSMPATIAVDNVTATGGQTMDENYKAQRVLVVGSQSNASLTINGTITGITNSINAYIGGTAGTLGVRVGQIDGSVAVYFSPANPSVNATFSSSSMEVVPTTGSRKTMDDAHAAQRVLIAGSQTAASLTINGSLTGITNTIATVPVSASGSTITDDNYKAQRVLVVGSQSNASLTINGTITGITNSINAYIGGTAGTLGVRVGQIDGSVAVYFSPANPTVNATFSSTSMEVVPTTGSRKTMDDAAAAQRVLIAGSQTNASLTINGTITGITNSINVYVGATGGTLWVKPDPAGTYFTNNANTASIFTVSGTTSTAGNNTLVSPSASYNFKVFAYSIQTTGLVSMAPRFTTGASAGATELWRPMISPATTTSAPVGANLAVPPPGFIFSTGTNTTLALYLDTGSLIHYSVSYIKESA